MQGRKPPNSPEERPTQFVSRIELTDYNDTSVVATMFDASNNILAQRERIDPFKLLLLAFSAQQQGAALTITVGDRAVRHALRIKRDLQRTINRVEGGRNE